MCRLALGDKTPIPTLPILFITNCVESGLVESSTTNELPVPVCVILTKSWFVEPEAIINGNDCEPETWNLEYGKAIPIPTLDAVVIVKPLTELPV